MKKDIIQEEVEVFGKFLNEYAKENGDEHFISSGYYFHDDLKDYFKKSLIKIREKEYQRIKRYLKKGGMSPDLREPVATKLGGNQPKEVRQKISQSIKEWWRKRKLSSPRLNRG